MEPEESRPETVIRGDLVVEGELFIEDVGQSLGESLMEMLSGQG